MHRKILRILLLMSVSALAVSAATLREVADEPELGMLPTILGDKQMHALAQFWSLPFETLQAREQVPPDLCNSIHANPYPLGCAKRKWMFSNALQHPLTPQEAAVRDAVHKLGHRKTQFVLCELTNGKKLSGTINEDKTYSFVLNTGLFNQSEELRYADLRLPPRPILGIGRKVEDGLEIAGLVAVVILAIPALPIMIIAGVPD
jgi:hypothetical protein